MNLSRNQIFAITCLLWLSAATGCSIISPAIQGSGISTTETREVSDFNQIEISVPLEIEVIKGETCSLEITIDDNLLQYVVTTVENGRLKVFSDENLAVRASGKLRLTAPAISRVSLAGAVSGTIEELNGDAVELSLAGSSDVTVGLQAEKLALEIAGSGKVATSGICQKLDISIAGSGTVHSEDVQAKDVAIAISGSGKVFVHATDSLEIAIAGSGTVQYRGQPTIKQSVAGSGDITQLK